MEATKHTIIPQIRMKFRLYWTLIKSLQTGLLLITGLAGFMSSRCPITGWQTFLMFAGSLFLAISGSTVLNMWYDRDIDARMKRTCWRPLPTGEVTPNEGLLLGLLLSALGIGWALSIDILYGLVVFAGLFFDVVVYTIWLKRRTAWSIVWGGISGGMPVLAGRVLGTGSFDWIGILLALAVLFWIPTHILTFSMRYHEDYQECRRPYFPIHLWLPGYPRDHIDCQCHRCIDDGGSSLWNWHACRILASDGCAYQPGYSCLLPSSAIKPSDRINFGLFKYASLYMLERDAVGHPHNVENTLFTHFK